MARLTVQNIVRTGLVPSYDAADVGGDSFPNDGQVLYHVKNGGGASVDVTFTSRVASAAPGTQVSDRVVSVGAGAEAMIGPWTPGSFNDSTGDVTVAYSAVTSVTVAAIKLNRNS